MAPLTPHWTQPSHPDIQEVVFGKDATDFSSKSLSKVAVAPGHLYATLTSPPCTFVEDSSYATVQAGRDRHILLNSDLLYLNHSCEPSLVSANTHHRPGAGGGGEGEKACIAFSSDSPQGTLVRREGRAGVEKRGACPRSCICRLTW